MDIVKFYIKKHWKNYLTVLPKAFITLMSMLMLTVFIGEPASYLRAPAGESSGAYSVGFGKADITPTSLTDKKGRYIYHLAGFSSNSYNYARSVAAPVYARAVYIDDNRGAGGVVLVSVDCIGLSGEDVNNIRRELSRFSKESGCASIQIMSTHCHESVDTLGLWGDIYGLESGINEGYMRQLYEGVKAAVKSAYADRRNGQIYYGETNAASMTYTDESGSQYGFYQYDQRAPYVADGRLVRFRFVPEDSSNEIYILNYAAHPETMYLRESEDQLANYDYNGHISANSVLSADYVGWLHEKIKEETGADSILFQGAIGGLIELRCYNFEVQSFSDYMMSNGYATRGELSELIMEYYMIDDNLWNILDAGTQNYYIWCDALRAALTTGSYKNYTADYTADYYERAIGFCIKRTKYAGYALARYAIAINDEEHLPPELILAGKEFDIPVNNTVYQLGGFAKIVHGRMRFGKFNGESGLIYRTEIGLLKLGGKKIALIPGELFPELAYGGYLEGDSVAHPETENPATLGEICGDNGVIVFGLANDHLGYIIPPNDFYLAEKLPYINSAVLNLPDGSRRSYYTETNSFGPHTAQCIADAFAELCETLPN